MDETKDHPICRACRHYSEGLERCYHPDVMTFDPLIGRQSQRARHLRRPGGECGIDAKLFEAIPPTPRSEIFMRAAFVVGFIGGFAWLVTR